MNKIVENLADLTGGCLFLTGKHERLFNTARWVIMKRRKTVVLKAYGFILDQLSLDQFNKAKKTTGTLYKRKFAATADL